MMEQTFKQLEATRNFYIKIIDQLDIDQLNTIPEGFNNSIAWNFMHAITTMQSLCYRLSNIEPRLPKEIINRYKKGTSPDGNVSQEDLDQMKIWAVESIQWLKKDIENNLFNEFTPYSTSFGYDIPDFKSSVQFNTVHEALHLGYIMAMKHLV